MAKMNGVLLIIASGFDEARRLAMDNGLWPLPARVRIVLRPLQLCGWSHGTPAIIGPFADWDDGAKAFIREIEAAVSSGRIAVADEGQIAEFAERHAA